MYLDFNQSKIVAAKLFFTLGTLKNMNRMEKASLNYLNKLAKITKKENAFLPLSKSTSEQDSENFIVFDDSAETYDDDNTYYPIIDTAEKINVNNIYGNEYTFFRVETNKKSKKSVVCFACEATGEKIIVDSGSWEKISPKKKD